MKSSPPRPRGRPRTFDRGEALRGAVRVFRERGYDAARVADLQAIGGIWPPSLYAAFGSKEELFRECVSTYVTSAGEAARCAIEAPAITTRDAIEQVLRANVATITKAGEAHGCMLVLGALNCAPQGAGGAAASAYLHRLRVDSLRGIAARIERGVRDLTPRLPSHAPVGVRRGPGLGGRKPSRTHRADAAIPASSLHVGNGLPPRGYAGDARESVHHPCLGKAQAPRGS